jgi:heme exporter protein B
MISRSFSIEKDRGTMVSLLLAPAERFELFIGKAFSNLLAVFFLELFAVPAFVLLFHYEPPAVPWSIIPIVALGTVGLVVTGSVLAAIAAASRSRELLMPVLLFPVMFPVFLVAVPATASALRGAGIDELLPGIGLLAGYDMVMLALSLLLFEYTVEG